MADRRGSSRNKHGDGGLLLIDANFLCWQALHTHKGLSHKGEETGVIDGFLSRLPSMARTLGSNQFVFCWDSKKSYRKRKFPWYKSKRYDDETEKDRRRRKGAFKQFDLLRKEILPELGLLNNPIQAGCEADDLIAKIVMSTIEECTIVTSDADLFQLLYPHVSVWNPRTRKRITAQSFREMKGVGWDEWTHVKALAGCESDTVPGIPGVGEGTAVKYINGTLPEHFKIYKKIHTKEGQAIYRRNLSLVRLPLFPTRPVELVHDAWNHYGFLSVCQQYGLASLSERLEQWNETFKGLRHV